MSHTLEVESTFFTVTIEDGTFHVQRKYGFVIVVSFLLPFPNGNTKFGAKIVFVNPHAVTSSVQINTASSRLRWKNVVTADQVV